MGGVFAQDSWRMTPELHRQLRAAMGLQRCAATITWAIANFPDMANLYGPSTALFQPGVLNGVANPEHQGREVRGRPSTGSIPGRNVGFAWTAEVRNGWLGKVFGDGDETVIRGSYNLTYYDEGTNMFAATAGNNPGQSQSLDLRPGLPGFVAGALNAAEHAATVRRSSRPEYTETFPNQSIFTFGSTGISTMIRRSEDRRTFRRGTSACSARS